MNDRSRETDALLPAGEACEILSVSPLSNRSGFLVGARIGAEERWLSVDLKASRFLAYAFRWLIGADTATRA
jgi:hypothetical protein